MMFNGQSGDDDVMAEINMTPLVDVMLVLLIIFIVAMPIVQHAVKLNLPQATAKPRDLNVKHVSLALQADGQMRWDGQAVEMAQLQAMAQAAVAQNEQIQLHVQADKATPYEYVAKTMAVVQNAGVSKIGLVTTPAP